MEPAISAAFVIFLNVLTSLRIYYSFVDEIF
jgi:hypothetical protein